MRSMLKRLAILLPVAAVHASLLFYMFSAGMEAVSAAGEQKTGAVLPGAQAVLTISGVTGGHAIKRTETPTGDLQKITWPAPDEKDPDEVMAQKAISSAPDAESGSAGRTAEISAHGIPQERHAAPERKSAGHAASGHKPGRSTERHRGDTAGAKVSAKMRHAQSSGRSSLKADAGTSHYEGKSPEGKSSGVSQAFASPGSAPHVADTRGSSGAGQRAGESYRMYGVSSSGVIVSCRTVLRYPEKSRRRGSEGRVKARVEAATDGRVISAEAAGSSGDWYLDSALTDFIKKCRFKSGGVYEVEAVFRLK